MTVTAARRLGQRGARDDERQVSGGPGRAFGGSTESAPSVSEGLLIVRKAMLSRKLRLPIDGSVPSVGLVALLF